MFKEHNDNDVIPALLSQAEIQDLVAQVTMVNLLDQHPLPHVVTYKRRFIYVNPAAVGLFDAETTMDLLGQDITTFIHPLDHGRVLTRLEILGPNKLANPPSLTRITTLKKRSKRILSTSMLITVNGQEFAIASGTDITNGIHRSELESDRNYQSLFENMLDVFYRTDKEKRLTLVGPAVTKMLGYKPEDVLGLPAASFYVDPNKREEVVARIARDGEIKDFQVDLKHKSGYPVSVEISSRAIYDSENNVIGVEGVFRDVTEQNSMKESLQLLAATDELTGIFNRREFLRNAEMCVKKLKRHPETSILAIVDLDKFKQINDDFGHLSGDKILKIFTEIFKRNLRETDIFGRLGGDEFSIILQSIDKSTAQPLLERMLSELRSKSLRLRGDVQINISASIGATFLTSEDHPLNTALARADQALYQAKKHGGSCLVIYD